MSNLLLSAGSLKAAVLVISDELHKGLCCSPQRNLLLQLSCTLLRATLPYMTLCC